VLPVSEGSALDQMKKNGEDWLTRYTWKMIVETEVVTNIGVMHLLK